MLKTRELNSWMLLGVFAVSFVAGGCGKRVSSDSSDLDHDMDQTTRSSSGWQWHDVTDFEIDEVFMPMQRAIFNFDLPYLDASDPLAMRAQAWVNKIDRHVRSENPSALSDVPRPKVIVTVNPSFNAYMAPVPVCLNIGVLLNPLAETSVVVPSVLLTKAGQFVPDQLPSCVEKELTAYEAISFVKWINSELGSCQLKFLKDDDGAFHVIPNQECALSAQMEEFFYAGQLVYLPSSNYLTVNSGLIKSMDEEKFAAVAAHELGHFYKGHAVLANGNPSYDFFYKMEETNPTAKPVPDSSLSDLGQKVRQASLPTMKYRRLQDQKIRSELFMPVVMMGAFVNKFQSCEDGICNVECVAFIEFMKEEETQSELARFPFGALGTNGASVYTSFEEKSLACLSQVKIGTDEKEVLAGRQISALDFHKLLNLDSSLKNMFSGLELASNVTHSLNRASTRIELATYLATEPLRKAKDLHLGYYTAEQEADELSVEWLSEIGVDPARVVETDFVLSRMVEGSRAKSGQSFYPFTVLADQCETLYQNGWKDENGVDFYVPIADFQDDHHTGCFRAFNVDREIKAHGLVANPNAEPFEAPTGHSWGELQKHISEMEAMVAEMQAAKKAKKTKVSDVDAETMNLIREAVLPKSCSYFHSN